MTRCKKLSLVGGSPEMSLPSWSSFESRAGSRRPREEPVGVISQPSSVLALILPEDPAVRPRTKIDAPIAQISSLSLASLIRSLHSHNVFRHCREPQATKQSRLDANCPGLLCCTRNGEKSGSFLSSGQHRKGAQEKVGRAEIAGFEG